MLVDQRLMNDIASIVQDAIEANFESKNRQRRLGWPPLSELYVEFLRRYKPRRDPTILLKDEGRLFQSIDVETERNKVIAETNLKYAAIHQFGGKTGRGHKAEIPARPYIAFLDEDIDDMTAVVAEQISQNIANLLSKAVAREFGRGL